MTRQLALSGSVMLSDDASESARRLKDAFQDPFDHAALRTEARAAFVEPVLQENPLARFLTLSEAGRGHHAALQLAVAG